MRSFAEATGAKPCYSTNDLASCVLDAISDSRDYYLLGYYRQKDNLSPGWRTLKVQVDRPGVQVFARSGYLYLNEEPDTEEARRRDVSYALISPVDFPGLPFTVRVKQVPIPDGTLRRLNFQLQVHAGSLMNNPLGNYRISLEVVAAVANPSGALLDQFSRLYRAA